MKINIDGLDKSISEHEKVKSMIDNKVKKDIQSFDNKLKGCISLLAGEEKSVISSYSIFEDGNYEQMTDNESMLDLNMENETYSFVTDHLTSRIAVWTQSEIKIVYLDDVDGFEGETSIYQEINEFENIRLVKGVAFIPNGTALIVFEQNHIYLWHIEKSKKELISNISCQGDILWYEFYSDDRHSTMNMYQEFHANQLLVAFGWPDISIIKISIPTFIESHSTEIIQTIAASINFIEMNSPMLCYPYEASLKFKTRFMPNLKFLWTAMVSEDGLLVRVLKAVFSGQDDRNIEYSLISETTYDIRVDSVLIENSTPRRGGIAIATLPLDYVYYLAIKEDGSSELIELLQLPTFIKHLNSIFYDPSGFLMLTANSNRIYIYSTSIDGQLSLIYDTQLDSCKTTSIILHNLSKIVQVSNSQLKLINFAPRRRPQRFYYASAHHKRENDPNSNFLISVTRDLVVSTLNKSIILENILTKNFCCAEDVLPVDNKLIKPTESRLITVESSSKWILVLKYSKKVNNILSIAFLHKNEMKLPQTLLYIIEVDRDATPISVKQWFHVQDYQNLSINSSHMAVINKYDILLYNLKRETRDYRNQPKPLRVTLDHSIYSFLQTSQLNDNYKVNYGVVSTHHETYLTIWDSSEDISIKPRPKSTSVFQNTVFKVIQQNMKKPNRLKMISNQKTPRDLEDNPLKSSLIDSGELADPLPLDLKRDISSNLLNPAIDLSEDSSHDEEHDMHVVEEEPKQTELHILRIKSSMFHKEQTPKHESVSIYRGNDFIASSRDGQYIMIFGQKGYTLIKTSRMTCIRKRWKDKYKFTNKRQVRFSPCSKFVVMAFANKNEIHLLDLSSSINITSRVVAQCPNLLELRFYFKFYPDIDCEVQETLRNKMYLIVPHQSKDMEKVEIKVYDVQKSYCLATAEITLDMTLLAVHLSNTQNNVLGLHLLMSRKMDLDRFRESGFYGCNLYFTTANFMPLEDFIRSNLFNYFFNDEQSEGGYYQEMLSNTILTLQPHQIISDARLFSMIYIMNLESVLERVFVSRYDIEALFENYDIPAIVFNKDFKKYKNSALSIANLANILKSMKSFPMINSQTIEHIIKKHSYLDMCSTRGAQLLFIELLVSPCFFTISGQLENKDISFIKLNPKLAESTVLHLTYLRKKAKSLIVQDIKNNETFNVYRTRFNMNLTNGSSTSIHLMQLILTMNDDDIKSNFKELIRYKWNMIYKYSLAHTIFYYTMTLLVYTYYSLYKHSIVGYIVITMNCILLLFDWICFISDYSLSKKDAMLWIDVLVNTINMSAIICTSLKLDILSEYQRYFSMVCIILVSFRGILMLKTFRSMRMMITMVFNIIFELRFLPFVFVALLLVIAATYRLTPTKVDNDNITFIESIEDIIKVAFINKGNAEDVEDPVRASVAMLGAALLANSMFYMSLSILLQSYKKMGKDRMAMELRGLVMDIKIFDLVLQAYRKSSYQNKNYFLILKSRDNANDDSQGKNKPGIMGSGIMNGMFGNMVKDMAKRGLKQVATYGDIDFKKMEGFTKFVTKETEIIQKSIPKNEVVSKDTDEKKGKSAPHTPKSKDTPNIFSSNISKNKSKQALMTLMNNTGISEERSLKPQKSLSKQNTPNLSIQIGQCDEEVNFDEAFEIVLKMNKNNPRLSNMKEKLRKVVSMIQSISQVMDPELTSHQSYESPSLLTNPTVEKHPFRSKTSDINLNLSTVMEEDVTEAHTNRPNNNDIQSADFSEFVRALKHNKKN